MKSIYADIAPATGPHNGSICSVYVIPREWLAADPVIDFETGRVLIAAELKENKFWIRMDLLQQTYDFEETPKSNKSGDYKESALSGELNLYNYMIRQQLETLRRSQPVVLLTDMNKRRRLIGDTETGMIFSYNYSLKNNPGEEKITINMIMESEDPAPYYNPDNEPEIIYNFLENLDGNFLLVE
jgi:hypothetical protein